MPDSMQLQPQTPASMTSALMEPEIVTLIELSDQLYQRELQLHSTLPDYSFVLFPLAKAYEGFLKRFLLGLGMISQAMYQSRRFRIGRALNPDVKARQQDEEWLYDNLVNLCGREFADQLWEAWLVARNHIFHYFPNQPNLVTLATVKKYQQLMTDVMAQADQYYLLHRRRDSSL